ncbi:hypothetical protein UPYG_G00096940, partial [Umbra pygmaea]
LNLLENAQIKLVNGNGRCSGRVEVYTYGRWETVCDDRWDMNDAKVVCKQLGCGIAVSAKVGAYFGWGSGRIRMNNVACTGSESTLTECSHLRYFNCHHGKDAGVVCSGSRLKTPILYTKSSHTTFSPGEGIVFICSVPQRIAIPVTFELHRGGSLIMTQSLRTTETICIFTLSSLQSRHQGKYSCVQASQKGQKISSFSNAVDITIVILHQPNISLSTQNGRMFWAPQQSVVTRGQSFSITCSIQTQYPGGLFHLYFSGSNKTETKPSVNHTTSFTFPVADYEDQGNYSCSYEVNVSSRIFHSTKTDLLPVNIEASPVPFIVSGAVVGLLLLLLLLLIPFLIWRKRKDRQTPRMITQRECAACEDKDEEDYVNTEAFYNQNRYEDVKIQCRAGMNAPRTKKKCRNNQHKSKAAGKDEVIYENTDAIMCRAVAEKMCSDDNDYLDPEEIPYKVREENDYLDPEEIPYKVREEKDYQDDNIYANCE